MASEYNTGIAAKVANSATAAVVNVSHKQDNQLSPAAVTDAKPEIKEAITNAIANNPEFQHVTSTEPFYQRRSFWSAVVSIVGVVAAPLVMRYFNVDIANPETQEKIISGIITVAGLVSSYLAYRAGTAKKPIGPSLP